MAELLSRWLDKTLLPFSAQLSKWEKKASRVDGGLAVREFHITRGLLQGEEPVDVIGSSGLDEVCYKVPYLILVEIGYLSVVWLAVHRKPFEKHAEVITQPVDLT